MQKTKATATTSLAQRAYELIKADIFDFRLLPGERFSENELAARLGMSRTPIREGLLRLAREGYIAVSPKSGWNVCQLDFQQFEELYELRTVLEIAALRRLCQREDEPPLEALESVWLVEPEARLSDWRELGRLDEAFHQGLLLAAGNQEMARVHLEVSERIRIIRRLDFTKAQRIEHTYEEHARILRAARRRRFEEASLLLRSHIEASREEVRKITLHMLHTARTTLATSALP